MVTIETPAMLAATLTTTASPASNMGLKKRDLTFTTAWTP
jgi:hypothetical protein